MLPNIIRSYRAWWHRCRTRDEQLACARHWAANVSVGTFPPMGHADAWAEVTS